MKAKPLLVFWHDNSSPIYSAHFQPHGKGRLATAGGDNNVRIWKVENAGDDRSITYLSTLVKHTQAVNVVRWSPRGDILATAGDDGNVLLWVPSEHHAQRGGFGTDNPDDKETWIVKRMIRAGGNEIYDLAWSPSGDHFIVGSMDNVARIIDTQNGSVVRQIAEHTHYVQGVAWDPLNEYLATQSSDRSIHVYTLRTNDGQFGLSQHGRINKIDMPPRRRTSNSPAPPDLGARCRMTSDASSYAVGSPAPSAPGTPASLPLPMNPPLPATSSRRSSFGNASPSVRRSLSPAPSMPLPAVMPSASPRPQALLAKNANLYHNETLTSFFRRLTFAPDGSLLFTPAGQYKTSQQSASDPSRTTDEIINTVYIYGRAGLNKPPIAHLPGHRKPSVAVKCSPILYNHRLPTITKQVTIDTSAGNDDITPLPEPAVPSKPPTSAASMDPPAPTNATSPPPRSHAESPKPSAADSSSPGPQPAFALPYRIVYAVATQDSVYVYDTQQQTPLCVVSNLHYATFTDLTWSNDGDTLLMSSSDGFCSTVSFSPSELGSSYHGNLTSRLNPPTALNPSTTGPSSSHSTPAPTPSSVISGVPKPPTPLTLSNIPVGHPSPSPLSAGAIRPASPSRSESASSTTSSFPPSTHHHHHSHSHSQHSLQSGHGTPVTTGSAVASQSGAVITNPTPAFSTLPSVAATSSSSSVFSSAGIARPALTSPTPPMTPAPGEAVTAAGSVPSAPSNSEPAALSSGLKREGGAVGGAVGNADGGDREDGRETKKRRIAPTLVSDGDGQS